MDQFNQPPQKLEENYSVGDKVFIEFGSSDMPCEIREINKEEGTVKLDMIAFGQRKSSDKDFKFSEIHR